MVAFYLRFAWSRAWIDLIFDVLFTPFINHIRIYPLDIVNFFVYWRKWVVAQKDKPKLSFRLDSLLLVMAHLKFLLMMLKITLRFLHFKIYLSPLWIWPKGEALNQLWWNVIIIITYEGPVEYSWQNCNEKNAKTQGTINFNYIKNVNI